METAKKIGGVSGTVKFTDRQVWPGGQEEIVQWLSNMPDGNKKDTMKAFYREYEEIFRRFYEKKEEEKSSIEKPYGEQIEICPK